MHSVNSKLLDAVNAFISGILRNVKMRVLERDLSLVEEGEL